MLARYKTRLDRSEEELAESRRAESTHRKNVAKASAQAQTAVREVARGEKRLIAAVNASKKIENECMIMLRSKEAENRCVPPPARAATNEGVR